MYYLISAEYVGPNGRNSHGQWYPSDARVMRIQTEPGRKNMSHEVAIDGWLGTTNDTAEYAYGEYQTIEAARAECDRLGFTVVQGSDAGDMMTDPDVIEYRTTPAGAREQWDGGDWLNYASPEDYGITAKTTDEELDVIAEGIEDDAAAEPGEDGYGIELHDTAAAVRRLRDRARN